MALVPLRSREAAPLQADQAEFHVFGDWSVSRKDVNWSNSWAKQTQCVQRTTTIAKQIAVATNTPEVVIEYRRSLELLTCARFINVRDRRIEEAWVGG